MAKVPKNRPRTKHIAVKYHHFREAVRNGILLVERVSTDKQLADIMTKPLPIKTLEYLRSNIMGWTAVIHRYKDETNIKNLIDKVMSWTEE